jgi:two-component system sensor histidine kinase QseC
MKTLSAFFRPTLVRRVVLALLAASVLIWLVLMAYYYWQESSQSAAAARQHQRGEAVLAVLSEINDATQARQAVALYSALFNSVYLRAGVPERFLIQLEDQTGQRLYLTPGSDDIGWSVHETDVVSQQLQGRQYQVYRGKSTLWMITLAEPVPAPAVLLARLSSNLTISVLISFPLLLLPVWYAVSRGLSPLRRLSDAIAARGPDDLQPLGLDMTYAELMPLTTALDRLFSQLRARISREHSFVQDAAHELRTPIAVIAAQAHVMRKTVDSEDRLEAAQYLDAAIARVSHLIDQLLDLARFDTASSTAATKQDVAQLLRQELVNVAVTAMARDIELSLEAPDQLTCVLDAQAWQSIVQNLLSNAVRYGRDGGQVVVELVAQNGILTLSITDDGPGISPAEQSLVFERFYRVAGTDITGSGLGLAIVAQAVTRLGGKVRLEQGLQGRGCNFIVEIPVG